jgi:hypothetical protein
MNDKNLSMNIDEYEELCVDIDDAVKSRSVIHNRAI